MTLSETWYMEGYIDFELQKYRLLAYLKEVKDNFSETRLFPQLTEIIAHFKNLQALRLSKQAAQDGFPKEMKLKFTTRPMLIYERLLEDDDVMKELNEITTFAETELKQAIVAGTTIYDQVARELHIAPVGILPLYTQEGYLFLHYQSLAAVRIYGYTVTLFENKDARYKGVHLDYIENRALNATTTYEKIKIELVRSLRKLPNPAVYLVECPLPIPLDETLIPVTKAILARQLGSA